MPSISATFTASFKILQAYEPAGVYDERRTEGSDEAQTRLAFSQACGRTQTATPCNFYSVSELNLKRENFVCQR